MESRTIRNLPFYSIVSLCFIGLLSIPVNPLFASKMINVAGFLSLAMLVINFNKEHTKANVILAAGLFLLGTLYLTWYSVYKTDLVIYKNAYRGYLEAGKMLALSSFIILYVGDSKVKIPASFHNVVSLIAQLMVFFIAFYQKFWLGADRIPLSAMGGTIDQMGAATTAAYIIIFLSMYSSIVILHLESKYKWLVFYLNALLSFSAIMMTGTRAAIFAFPIAIIFVLLGKFYKQKKLFIKCVVSFIFLLLVCGLIFHKEVIARADSFKNDVIHFTNYNNSSSSIGARLSMFAGGYLASPPGLEWQSLEQRANKIIALSEKDSIYTGAIEFLDVHMHNEIIEALSTKGVIGVVILLCFYGSMICCALVGKKYMLLGFPVAIILLGISDVITHDKSIPASWISSLILSILFLRKRVE